MLAFPSLPFFLLAILALQEVPYTQTVAALEARYRFARTSQAVFLENYTENGRLVRSEAGTVYFRRTGKMRWEYESPEKNLFLVDGKTAWFYVPADHTVTRLPVKRSTDWRAPLALLAGEARLDKVCAQVGAALDVKPENAEDAVLFCVPRGTERKTEGRAGRSATPREDMTAEQSIDKRPVGPAEPHQRLPEEVVFLEVSKTTGDLLRVLVRERGSVELEFHFTNWKFDQPLNDALFRFDVPPGVAIVNGESSVGNTGINQ